MKLEILHNIVVNSATCRYNAMELGIMHVLVGSCGCVINSEFLTAVYNQLTNFIRQHI